MKSSSLLSNHASRRIIVGEAVRIIAVDPNCWMNSGDHREIGASQFAPPKPNLPLGTSANPSQERVSPSGKRRGGID
ncbi:unnamed protein product [Linum trigynum]|uniref:Uncharacterized protein n=1 Tax=Linum trigynum TaxID=586398 RepID=A0AAV2G7Z3_9ROSI